MMPLRIMLSLLPPAFLSQTRVCLGRTSFIARRNLHKVNSRLTFVQGLRSYTTDNDSTKSIFGGAGLKNYLRAVLNEYVEVTDKLMSNDLALDDSRQELSKRHAELSPLAERIREYYKMLDEIHELEFMEKDCDDEELKMLAIQDKARCEGTVNLIEQEILDNLVPHEVADMNDIILEVTAGVGGTEAMLFSKELFDMYQNFGVNHGWRLEVVNYAASELGGMRHAMAMISGVGAYGSLKYEGGVHRVQRVPKTEKSGRVHTSTSTVAILPQPQEIDVQLEQKDLKIETCRSSGKGGQHINTTDSAVRIVHLPTGESAECQTQRSQLKNRDIAMRILRSRIYQKQLDLQVSKEVQQRKLQVGSAGRSEKIRTYNYNQDRITDHRIGFTQHGVNEFLEGGDLLDNMIYNLKEESRKETLTEMLKKLNDRYIAS